MKFLHSVLLIRPYLEIDVGALLEFNQRLDQLGMQDTINCVIELYHTVELQLMKNKVSLFSQDEERVRQEFEDKLVEREKLEEEQTKKKSEEQEDSKFDYLTLLVNTTKKYGNMRRAGGGAMAFKNSANNKKSIATAGIKQFQSPPVPTKGNLLEKQSGPFSNGNISVSLMAAPI